MKKAQNTFPIKLKPYFPKSKSQKRSQTITRCQVKQVPKIRNKSISFYQISYKKQHAEPLNNGEDSFTFWGCSSPPQKLHIKNPYEKQTAKVEKKNITGQSTTLLSKYLNRRDKQDGVKVISWQDQAKPISRFKERKMSDIVLGPRNKFDSTYTTINTGSSKQIENKFFISTMISECEDSTIQPYVDQFRPIKENLMLEKMHELKQKILLRNSLLDKIKDNMAHIKFKKMSMFN